jgi:uncharacterized membrane protein (UPF0127 family)
MKDRLILLSIAFVDAHGRVVSISDMQRCGTDPCPTYAASGAYTLAVEANLGWFAHHHRGVEVRRRRVLRRSRTTADPRPLARARPAGGRVRRST